MSFWDSALKIISAPVTLPAAGFAKIVDKVGGDAPTAQLVANAFRAPAAITKNGVSAKSIAEAKNLAGPVLNIAQTAFGASGGSILGFDASKISGLTDMFGNTTPSAGVKELPGYSTNDVAAPATPFKGPPKTDFITPVAVIGGAGILAYFLFRSKK